MAVTEFSVTLTSADTEYSYTLPANTTKLTFRCRNGLADIRYAWTSGKVATQTDPYQVLDAGANFSIEDVTIASGTIYFASSTAGVVVEGEAWT